MKKNRKTFNSDIEYLKTYSEKQMKEMKYHMFCEKLFPLIRPIIVILLGVLMLSLEQGRPLLNLGCVPYVLFGIAVYDLWCNI